MLPAATGQPLRLTLHADKHVFVVGEPLRLWLRIDNLASTELRIPLAADRGFGDLLDVSDSDGVLLPFRGEKVTFPAGDDGSVVVAVGDSLVRPFLLATDYR